MPRSRLETGSPASLNESFNERQASVVMMNSSLPYVSVLIAFPLSSSALIPPQAVSFDCRCWVSAFNEVLAFSLRPSAFRICSSPPFSLPPAALVTEQHTSVT